MASDGMKPLLLVGAGSGSREVLLLVHRMNAHRPQWRVLGFVDDDAALVGTNVDGYPVFAADHPHNQDGIHAACGILDPATRERLLASHVEARGYSLATLIAPDVVLPPDFSAAPGTVIMPSVTVSFEVQLGKGVFVLWGATLGHHLRVGQFGTILSGALIAGGCDVGHHSIIGAGAVVNVGVSIGSNALVGVGTTILASVPDGSRVVSMPRLVTLPG